MFIVNGLGLHSTSSLFWDPSLKEHPPSGMCQPNGRREKSEWLKDMVAL